MTDVVQVALITGVCTLIASSLGLVISLITTIFNKKKEIELERIKIFDGNKFDAYILLYQFLRNVRLSYRPDEEFEKQIIGDLKSDLFKSTIKLIGYYSKSIRKHLITLDNEQIFYNNRELYVQLDKPMNSKQYLHICECIFKEVEKTFANWDK
ncbi:MAG TPA: hypothetical protein PK624_13260 [Spirochaetota bacterium]|nr:hypothetical protein [Spirochaetota bacterium]HOR45755.1 hypothetical protein [Spirochaetota bacterium]HPK57344.1 hypothetical protein [Spirochaetota bacterium]